jgi:hypothetical protein
MAIDFPNSPSSGDIHTVSGKQWSWDGEKWLAYGASLAPDILKIDTGNNRVGINQTTPTVALDVTGSARITGDLTVSGTTVTVDLASVLVKDRIVFEGSSADEYETTLIVTNPTGADKTITLPNADGTVAMTNTVLPLAGGAMTGAITTNSTFDGIDIAVRDAVLTSTTTTADAALPKAGGAMTGAITTNSTFDGVDIAVRDAILTSTTTTATAALPATGGTLAGVTLSGTVVGADQIISAPVMKDYAETVYAGGNTSTAQTLALTNGNVQTWTMTGNCTFTMPSGSTLQAGSSLTLILTQDGTGSRTGAFTSVKWAGGTAVTLTTTATTGIDILTFTTFNGGASPVWHGFAAGLAMA